MEKPRVLVCSAWPYASGLPHLGNMVSSLLSGDVFARYYRLRGKDVLYVSGSDAHGTRIEFEARQMGVSAAELAERNHQQIQEIIERFGIEFDNYTTTESPVHVRFVREIYLQMEENGYICTQIEQRAFCLHCGKFLADRLITGTCPRCGSPHALGDQCDACGAIIEPEELVDPRCSFCGREEIEFRETKHWYLDLGRLAPALERYVASRDFQGNVHLFTQRMIEEGLRPRAMTRDIEWGIPAPFDGADGKVIYVWGEAALGYVSAVIERFGAAERWRDFWFGDDVHQIYTIGKDNIPFHTLIFPGQLIASGRGYHLPDQVAATEYLNWIGGDSFSKTRGVGLYCDAALELMDAELWRFYLLYNRPEGRDVSFSWEELEKAVNGVLISNVANLMNRVVSFVQTQMDHRVPDGEVDGEVRERLAAGIAGYEAAMRDGLLSQGVRTVCDLAVYGNEYFQRKRPWATQDTGAAASALHLVKGMAVLLLPYLPMFAARVLAVMGIDRPCWEDVDRPVGGARLSDDRAIIERIDAGAMREATERAGRPATKTNGIEGRPTIPFGEFGKLDLRIARVQGVEEIPGADRLYKLTVDLGEERPRTCVAGIKGSYTPSELVGRRIVVVANLEPTVIKGVSSECMLLAAKGAGLSLIGPDGEALPGTPVA